MCNQLIFAPVVHLRQLRTRWFVKSKPQKAASPGPTLRPSVNRSLTVTLLRLTRNRVCFFVLCNEIWFNRASESHSMRWSSGAAERFAIASPGPRRPLRLAAQRKVNSYRQQYADNQNISFLPAIMTTSSRTRCDALMRAQHSRFAMGCQLHYQPQ